MKPIYHTLRNVFLKKKLAVLGFCCYLRRHESHQWHLNKNQNMGRNKFAEDEIKEIAKLLRLKNAGNRAKQKLVRHDLRTIYEFNISDLMSLVRLSVKKSYRMLSNEELFRFLMMPLSLI